MSVLKNILVSSAKRKNLSFDEVLGKSFIYNKNKSGPRTEPCGTPHERDLTSDLVLLQKTY